MFAKGTSIVLLLASLALAMPSQQLDAKKCDAAIVALVAGINKNIDVQKQELAQTKILQKQAAGTIVKATYDADVKTLQNIIAEGAKIRENNQKIAPPGNKALDGLKVVSSNLSALLRYVTLTQHRLRVLRPKRPSWQRP